MGGVLTAVYGFYLVMVGAKGNACNLFTMVSQEKQFLYWVVVLIVLSALWETESGEQFAKPFAALIVIGFLLHNNNWQVIMQNAKDILPQL